MQYPNTHVMTIAFLVAVKGETLPIPSECPAALSRLMRQCWDSEPRSRPTFRTILLDLGIAARCEREGPLLSGEEWAAQQERWRQEMATTSRCW